MQLHPFSVKVLSKESLLFEGDVLAVSSQNVKGPFDILSYHVWFVSTLEKKVTLLLEDNKKKEFETNYGVIHVTEEQATIYLGL